MAAVTDMLWIIMKVTTLPQITKIKMTPELIQLHSNNLNKIQLPAS